MAFRTSPSDSSDSGGPATQKCVYCLGNAEIGEDQVLAKGHLLYLCAPLGQVTEGYLVIAPYECIGSLSQLPVQAFPELARLKRIVERFYTATYRVEMATYYEQGRAGGGTATDAADGFPLHAHLCCLPVMLDLHSILVGKYARQDLAGPHELPHAARGEPYVYAESADSLGQYRRSVYRAHSNKTRMELRHMRLKPAIAELMNLPGRGNWRDYPGDQELQQLIMKFGIHKRAVVSEWR
jgi:diadenosine tetraphosphate (Ap4A) HIT family hydrolase